jgi:hypothetical protein
MAELLSAEMAALPPGARHYRVGADDYVAVMVDTEALTAMAEGMLDELHRIIGADIQSTMRVVRPTEILAVTADGLPIDMTPLHTFPPGTSHEDALTRAGYTIGAG